MIINATILLIGLSGSSIIIFSIVFFWILSIERRLKKMLIGKNAESLEDSIHALSKDTTDLRRYTKDIQEYLVHVEQRLKKSVQSIETIRFNPFKGTGSGGNNSFSSAFLNEQGDGLVLTSLYTRDRISIFAKPIKGFGSTFELSEEELQSINQCKKNLTIS